MRCSWSRHWWRMVVALTLLNSCYNLLHMVNITPAPEYNCRCAAGLVSFVVVETQLLGSYAVEDGSESRCLVRSDCRPRRPHLPGSLPTVPRDLT